MILGVIAFSYATGALSSLIQDDDNRRAQYQQKMITLKKLNDLVKMDPLLQREIESYIKVSTDVEIEEKNSLIDELPERLRNRLSLLLFDKH